MVSWNPSFASLHVRNCQFVHQFLDIRNEVYSSQLRVRPITDGLGISSITLRPHPASGVTSHGFLGGPPYKHLPCVRD